MSRNDYSGYINEFYDRKLEAKRAALSSAYEQKLAANAAEEAKLGPEYYAAKNRVASAAETEKRNFDEYANARGLGSEGRDHAVAENRHRHGGDVTHRGVVAPVQYRACLGRGDERDAGARTCACPSPT